MQMTRQSYINLAVRAAEIIVASLLAYYFRRLVDWLVLPFGLSEWVLFAAQVVFLVLFILVILWLHSYLMDYLKKIGVLPQDFKW